MIKELIVKAFSKNRIAFCIALFVAMAAMFSMVAYIAVFITHAKLPPAALVLYVIFMAAASTSNLARSIKGVIDSRRKVRYM